MTGRNLKSFKHFRDFRGFDVSHDSLVLFAMYSLLSMVGTDHDTRQIRQDVAKLVHTKEVLKLRRIRKSNQVNRVIHQLESNLKININKLNSYIDRLN